MAALAPPALGALDPLDPVSVEAVELVRLNLPLAVPLASAAGARRSRDLLLVHLVAEGVEGWAECAAETAPTYGPEFVDAAVLVLRAHLVPLVGGRCDAATLRRRMAAVRGHRMAKAALELAVLDAQLRAAGRSLADWLGATRRRVPPGATVGLHDSKEDLLAEVDAALCAGAARVRVKVRPGRALAAVAAIRAHAGSVALQADANGSFDPAEPDHLRELEALDEHGLVCLEQPLPPEDLVAHARLADRLVTPICLDESVSCVGDLDAAVALGACEALCLKPGRVGGWIEARRIHDRCFELGLPVWVGGMLETGLGRAANTALAALAGMTLAPDLDPRGRFDPDLADAGRPGADGQVAVPTGPGTGVDPDAEVLAGATFESVALER